MSETLSYQIKKNRRSRSIRININAAGQVSVSAPWSYPDFLIKQFVNKQQAWILKQQAKAAKKQIQLKADELLIFGQRYHIKVDTDPKLKLGVNPDAENKQLVLRLIKGQSQQKLIERFLKNTATKYLTQKTAQLSQTMAIHYNKITIRQQSSRWGSCSSQGNLNFNWRLVHYPPAIINYVIIHELAHRQHLNHSAAFWQLVKKYDPHYKQHQKILKQRLYNS